MKTSERKAVKMAIEYLDSFIECESSNYNNCDECGLRYDAKDVVDFREARIALDYLNNIID